MTLEKESEYCDWCNKREMTSSCTSCGVNLCKRCAVEEQNGAYYCKSCILSKIASNQSCD